MGGIWASRVGFESWGWDLSHEAGIWASRLGLRPQDWDLGLKTGIQAVRLGFESGGVWMDAGGKNSPYVWKYRSSTPSGPLPKRAERTIAIVTEKDGDMSLFLWPVDKWQSTSSETLGHSDEAAKTTSNNKTAFALTEIFLTNLQHFRKKKWRKVLYFIPWLTHRASQWEVGRAKLAQQA